MGEYAIRKSDGVQIKIGTCEEMFYLRFEDRDKVRYIPNSVNLNLDKVAAECRFRLPFPDEDDILPGNYKDHRRGVRLYRSVNSGMASAWHQDFTDESTVDDPGNIQLRHEASGLLLNVPCYHGHKLPEVAESMRAFWNGKRHSLELTFLRPVLDGELRVYPVVGCRHCSGAWRYEWSDIWEFIPLDMQRVLRQYAEVFSHA